MVLPPPTPPTFSSNTLGLDFRAEASSLSQTLPIIDCHTHIHGRQAARIYREVRELFGVSETWSMTPLEELDNVLPILGNSVRLIAMADFRADDQVIAHGSGFAKRIDTYFSEGATIAKFWCAPRSLEWSPEPFATNPFRLFSDNRRQAMDRAAELGMNFMFHVADPDTWFRTTYRDPQKYGTKAQHYDELEQALDHYQRPTFLAHCGGSPEDLARVDQLLTRYPFLSIDTSAAKWMVREFSLHPVDTLRRFFHRWQHRILFGTDIVTLDAHLSPDKSSSRSSMAERASSPDEAFELYASRYFVLRYLLEGEEGRESPIRDPDLTLDPSHPYAKSGRVPLPGIALPATVLRSIYSANSNDFNQLATNKKLTQRLSTSP